MRKYQTFLRLLAAQRCPNPLPMIEHIAEMDKYLAILEGFLSSDDDEVRLAVLEQVTGIFLELKKKCQTYFERANWNLPRCITHALGLSIEAQVNAVNAITNLIDSNSIAPDVITDVFVPGLFAYVHEATGESEVEICSLYCNNISNAVTILCRVASSPNRYSPTWMFEHFLRDFSALFLNRNADVRKLIANVAIQLSLSTIGTLAKHFGHVFTERCVVPHLANAIHDASFWVRKICCTVFVDVAQSASMEVRQRTLTPLFLLLLNDSDGNIYDAAIRQIGPFIATFADPRRRRAELKDGRLKSENPNNWADRNESSSSAGLNKIKSFSSTDDLTALQSLDENIRCRLDDEGIDDSASNDSNDENERDENDGVTIAHFFNDMPPGFILPGDINDRQNDNRSSQASSTSEHDEEEQSDEQTIRLWRTRVDMPRTLINTTCKDVYLPTDESENDNVQKKDIQTLKKDAIFNNVSEENRLKSSMTFWSFGNMSTISETDVRNYFARSLKRKRIRNLSKNLNGDLFTSHIKKTIEAECHNKNAPLTIENRQNAYCIVKTEFVDEEAQLAVSASSELHPIKDETKQEEVEKTIPVFEGMENEDWIMPISESSNKKTGSPNGSNYWQRRLDLLHKSVQSVVHNSSSALAAAALLPSSLKRLSLDSLNNASNANTSENSAAKTVMEYNAKSNVKPKSEKLASKAKSNSELWTVTEHKASSDNSKERTISLRSRFTTTAVTDSRHFTVAEKLKLRILEVEDELAPDERKNYNSGGVVESAPPVKEQPTAVSRASSLPPPHQRQSFTDEELKLLCDSTQDIVPQELLERLNEELLNRSHFEMNWHIAHSMPAIIYTLGRKNWVHIKGLYLYLTDHYHMEVRKSLANSLHEVAAIIGTNNADRDLLPVFLKFLEDTADVRYGLLRNLYHFCKVLSFSSRRQLAQKLNLFVTVDSNNSSYRIRAEFAEQLILLVRLFNAEEVNKFVCAYALTFATDRIAEVRSNGVKILAEVLALFIREEWAQFFNKYLSFSELGDNSTEALTNSALPSGSILLPLTDSLLHDVRVGFWRTRNWRRRQSFGRMLDFILRKELITEDQFFYIFYDDFMHVSEDEVANVRQYFCSMCKLTRASGFFKADRSVSISVRSRLKGLIEEDPDLEIRHQALIALGELDPDTAEIDLGQRGIQLQEATESIYNRCRSQRLLSSERPPEEERVKGLIYVKYDDHKTLRKIFKRNEQFFESFMTDISKAISTTQYSSRKTVFRGFTSPQLPPLVLNEQDDDDDDNNINNDNNKPDESILIPSTAAPDVVFSDANEPRRNDNADADVRAVIDALLCATVNEKNNAPL